MAAKLGTHSKAPFIPDLSCATSPLHMSTRFIPPGESNLLEVGHDLPGTCDVPSPLLWPGVNALRTCRVGALPRALHGSCGGCFCWCFLQGLALLLATSLQQNSTRWHFISRRFSGLLALSPAISGLGSLLSPGAVLASPGSKLSQPQSGNTLKTSTNMLSPGCSFAI